MYLEILAAIKRSGAQVLSEIFVHDAINLGGSPLPVDQIYARDIAMIQACDYVIAEVTNPSLGVGYELAYAEKLGRPILCLFDEASERKLSAMVAGNPYNTIGVYTAETLDDILNEFIASTLHQIPQRKTDH